MVHFATLVLRFITETCLKRLFLNSAKAERDGTERDGTRSCATSCRHGGIYYTDICLLPLVSIFQLQVKDLKRQLKLERKRAEQLQQKLQEALTENRVKPGTLVILFISFLLCFYLRLMGSRLPYTTKNKVVRIKAIMTSKKVINVLIYKQFLLTNAISKELRLVVGICMLTTHVD